MSNEDTIREIIKKINSMENIPKHWFKRNHGGYRVVSAVNNVICLYLSDELEDFFIDRIDTELQRVQNRDNAHKYIALVEELTVALHKYLLVKISKTKAKSLNLLILRCSDIEKSKDFYKKLSLSFVKEQHGKGAVHYATTLGDMILELYPLGNGTVDNTRLGFMVNSIKPILEDKMVEIVSEYEFDGKTTYVIVDPDGRKVEIVEENR